MTALVLLERIGAALSAGDLETVTACTAQLEAEIALIRREDAAAVQVLARDLGPRLQAAADGVRAARWRLAEIRAMGRKGDRLVTYDGQGQRHDTGGSTSLARRV
ncbi:hypothetical protein [Falsirhodobacter deserti]|uniref:hypothetical protein n=1 Tax=Falsirhodobacter deserti TaxID=1365611 RepID=UPI000FE3C541|nr:hypothetical protein [Falsirhodobacter deserti]